MFRSYDHHQADAIESILVIGTLNVPLLRISITNARAEMLVLVTSGKP
jgi:hypothetical protein